MERDEQGYLVFASMTEWRENTAYHGTTVSTAKSMADIRRLLIDKFRAEEVIVSERQGGQVAVAFKWRGKGYVIPVRRAKLRRETQSQIARLQRQAMRALLHYLKNLLLVRFLTSEEELLMPHMMIEGPDGRSVRAASAVLSGALRPALPSGKEEVVEGEFTGIEE